MTIELLFSQIEELITQDPGERRICQARIPGDFRQAAYSLYDSKSVIIVTGFCIRDAMAGETDGPPGAVVLAGALEKLGKEVILVTDRFSQRLVQVCAQLMGTTAVLIVVPRQGAAEFSRDILRRYRPSHVVALERPGRAEDGRCYSMRGEDLSDIVPDTDALFAGQGEDRPVTVGIGDGGNELGMGKVAAQIGQLLPLGKQICAAAAADFLVTAGVSNWGGYGLSAALSLLAGRCLLHDPTLEERFVAAMIAAGGVDGCTKRAELSVDGISLEVHKRLVSDLTTVINAGLRSASEKRAVN